MVLEVPSAKTGNAKAEETWMGSLFQNTDRDGVDEKDFEVAIVGRSLIHEMRV